MQGLKSLLGRLDRSVARMVLQRRDSVAPPDVRRTSSMKRSSVMGDPKRASISTQDPAAVSNLVKRSTVMGDTRRASTLAQEPAAVSKPGATGGAQIENARPSMIGTFLLSRITCQSCCIGTDCQE